MPSLSVNGKAVALRTIKSHRAMRQAAIYLPTHRSALPLTIHMNTINGPIRAYWFDPRQGTSALIGDFTNTGTHDVVPPTTGENNDWILVLDAIAANYPPLASKLPFELLLNFRFQPGIASRSKLFCK
jgi:hypothetical protein